MDHNDYGGLHEDLRLTGSAMKRRDLLRLAAGGMGALYLFGRAGDVSGSDDAEATCDKIPEETAGPFPADGSNGPDVLSEAGVVRADIRPSFAGLSGMAPGVPLTVNLRLVDLQNGCAPAAGLAVYVWHCDREGRYSLYNRGVTEQNYLRGGAGERLGRRAVVHNDLPGLLPGPVAAHPLRGIPQPRRRDRRAEQDRDLSARVSGSCLRRSVRSGRV